MDVVNCGLFTAIQKGNNVEIVGNLSKEEHAEFLASLPERLELLKKMINSTIMKVVKIIEKVDHIELLKHISFMIRMKDLKDPREEIMEYAINLSLACENRKFDKKINSDELEEVFQLFSELSTLFTFYISMESGKKTTEYSELEELVFKSRLNFLFVRGHAYQQHYNEMLKKIFESHDTFFKKLEFSSEELMSTIFGVYENIKKNIIEIEDGYNKIREMHQHFCDNATPENFMQLTDEMRESDEVQQDLSNSIIKINTNPFKIVLDDGFSIKILDLLSASFGDNKNFLEGDCAGWITKESILRRKPIIKYNDEYYCYSFINFYHNIQDVIENLIKETDQSYFDSRYQKKRSKILENEALKCFQMIFKTAEVYHSLKYDSDGECDGLVIYDNNLFIIEAKANDYSLKAQSGNYPQFVKCIKDIIDTAYSQAKRTKDYIANNDTSIFKDYQGNEIKIEKSKYRNVFLINVSFEQLNHLSTQLNALRKSKFIQSSEWFWSVNIFDLKVISETVESPSVFINYLKRRLRYNDFEQFKNSDELDIFGHYLEVGLYFEEQNIYTKNNTHVSFSYSSIFDEFYYGLKPEKPKLKIPDRYKNLVFEIEKIGKFGYTDVTESLISISCQDMEKILESIDSLRQRMLNDGIEHQFFQEYSKQKTGICFWLTPHKTPINKDIETYRSLKMYERKLEKYVLVILNYNNSETPIYDCEFFEKKWGYSPAMELKMERFKEKKKISVFNQKKKIGRNESCPCGSGEKYKRCCGK